MMHVISVPYSLMKVNPLSWIQKVYHFKGQTHQPVNQSLYNQLICQSIRYSHQVICQSFSQYLMPTLLELMSTLCVSLSSQGSVCKVQGHALGSGGPQRAEGHQPEFPPDAPGRRRI